MNSSPYPQPLKHGGNLTAAIRAYGSHPDGWLDMSTGISPWSWPISNIDLQLWQSLPPSTNTLLETAADYYQAPSEHIVACPGSQLAIRLVPRLLKASTVAVPRLGYQEHAYSWSLAGHNTIIYHDFSHLEKLLTSNEVEHAVIINPNNPTGDTVSRQHLAKLSDQAKGYILVDEAFADTNQINSAVSLRKTNLIILRSLGKFFGLAGLRIGFVISRGELVHTLKTIFEPWSLAGPSMHIAEQALNDKRWQLEQIQRIQIQADKFHPVLLTLKEKLGICNYTNTGLFHTFSGQKNAIDRCHSELAKAGIWSRLYNHNDPDYWLRLSLPKHLEKFVQRVSRI